MADGELWLTRDQALARLQRFLKLSVGAAEAAFDQAMSSRTIRSRAWHVILIEPSLERDVYYDRLDPEAWQRGDHRSINGEVSSDDLEFWVAQKLAVVSPVERATASRAQFETVCGLAEQIEPAEQSDSALSDPPRIAAVRKALAAGMNPPSTISWTAFCDYIRDDADGWLDKKEGTLKRGFDEKTIKRDVGKLRDGQMS
jgi:hypothetical protein